MDYFFDHYRARFQLPDPIYSDVKHGLQAFFELKNRSADIFIGSCVLLEPVSQAGTNAQIEKHNTGAGIEAIFVLITKVAKSGNGFIYGFVRVDSIPRPVLAIVDSLYLEAQLLKSEAERLGAAPRVLELVTGFKEQAPEVH